jgi:uncharacterized protein (TIGR02646 family)
MIKLKRERTEIAITPGLRGEKRKEKAIALLKKGYELAFEFKSKDFKSAYWKEAKEQLKKESSGKCAYCESPTEIVAHGDVEHFRPKSEYWWLAYCYENYSYSCQVCNQVYKSDKFTIQGAKMLAPRDLPEAMTDEEMETLAQFLFPDPFADDEGFPAADFLQACQQEQAHLVDPYLFDPEPYFKWGIDEQLEEVRIAPRDNTPESFNAFKAADDILGLNREELRKLRYLRYKELETFKDVLQAGGLPQPLIERIKQQLKEMTDDKAMFAGMARYFVRDVWDLDLS